VVRTAVLLVGGLVVACTPEVGSDAWCEAMRDKPTGDWTANQAADFAKHCVLKVPDGDNP
jgi:hypothetical protein